MKKGIFTVLMLASLSSPSPTRAATCTNPDGEPGVIYYNSLHGAFQGCTPGGWYAFHAPSCPAGDGCDAPASFGFSDATDAALSTQTLSEIVQINGLDREASVVISGDGSPEFRICDAGDCSNEVETWGAVNKYIKDGEYLQLRLTSSDTAETTLSATITINGTADQWDVTTELPAPPGPTNCDNIGDTCDDGSVYAGLSPDGNVPMYTTPADAGQFRWGSDGTARGTTSWISGETNTATLAAFGASAHPPAHYCDTLTAHGSEDWYLPARDELTVLFLNRTPIGGFNTSGSYPAGWYWSSSESASRYSRSQNFKFGGEQQNNKTDNFSVRCVRKQD